MTPRYVKPGEPIAILQRFLHQDRKGFFWMLGSGPVANERRGPAGDVAIIHVRGELEHHADSYYCESYEGIRRKWEEALSGQDAVKAHEREHRWDDDFQPLAATPPKVIVMVIDSPGGVVSGLNETVKALQKLRAEHPEVRTIAYCNEMAASAAYALACSCEKIIAPPSAIVGSVGVISTMVSQAARDKKEGFDVRLLTSGARKADGHLHAPISDAAVSVEQSRVDKLALSFFNIVSNARSLSIDKIRALQAGIFLGKDAIRVKLIDEVSSLDDVIAEATSAPDAMRAAGGNQTRRKATKMNLSAMIKKTKAAIAKEKDPSKIASLGAALASYEQAQAAYKKTEKYVEETVKEEETSAEEEETEEAAASEEEEEASAEMPDDEDDDDDDDEDEKKSAKSASAFRSRVEALTGKRGKAALGALEAMAAGYTSMAKDVAALKVARAKDSKAAMIEAARGKYLTRSDAEFLAKQPLAVVKGFIEHRKESGYIVHTDETTLHKPKSSAPGTEESLPPETLQIIDAAVASWRGADKEAYRKTLVAAHLADHKKAIDAALNGAGTGRY